MTAGEIRTRIYELYDEYLEACRQSDQQGLTHLIAEDARFDVTGSGLGEHWEGNAVQAVGRFLHTMEDFVGTEDDMGLDVYAVGVRGEGEAVALIEQWTDSRGTRLTRLALEVVRKGSDGTWRIAKSSAQEVSSALG